MKIRKLENGIESLGSQADDLMKPGTTLFVW